MPTTASRYRGWRKAPWRAGNILQRVRELSVQSASATNSAGDQDPSRPGGSAAVGAGPPGRDYQFNGQKKLLDGSFSSATFQVGANYQQTITATTGSFAPMSMAPS